MSTRLCVALTAFVSCFVLLAGQPLTAQALPPSIDLEKATNGLDADDPPGPPIPAGDPVSWTYVVTNLTEQELTQIEVTDDQGVMVSCPATTLAGNQSMTCTASGSAQLGPYANLGLVTALLGREIEVSDEDPSHYLGIATSELVGIEKATEGVDADLPPGPALLIGDPVGWTYAVTNTGSEVLSGVTVVDDQGVAVACPGTTLAPGESMTCTASGTVVEGQYVNIGTVTAELPGGESVTAADPSHYSGVRPEPAVAIQKATNGVDADGPPGPSIPVGGDVIWTYTVTNIGQGTLTEISVVDDQGVVVSCPATSLAAGESMVCTGLGTAEEGQYANLGTVTAVAPAGETLTAVDSSHYFGGLLGPIHLEKATNGVDADVAPGPNLVAGNAVIWTYVVTNSGAEALTALQVTDSDPAVVVSCPVTALAPGESMTCTANGVVVEGQYENVGTVTGLLPDLRVAVTTDPSHYLGAPPLAHEIPTQSGRSLAVLALILGLCGALVLRRLGS